MLSELIHTIVLTDFLLQVHRLVVTLLEDCPLVEIALPYVKYGARCLLVIVIGLWLLRYVAATIMSIAAAFLPSWPCESTPNVDNDDETTATQPVSILYVSRYGGPTPPVDRQRVIDDDKNLESLDRCETDRVGWCGFRLDCRDEIILTRNKYWRKKMYGEKEPPLDFLDIITLGHNNLDDFLVDLQQQHPPIFEKNHKNQKIEKNQQKSVCKKLIAVCVVVVCFVQLGLICFRIINDMR
jgi:hypothetical protein